MSETPIRPLVPGVTTADDQVLTRRHVEEREAQFRALADSIPQLVWMANPDGWIFWYNQRWYEYTGTKPEEMQGWGWQSVHDPEVLPSVLEFWRASIRSGEPFEMTFPLRGADGRFRPFLTRVVPLRDAAGNVTRWFGTNTDVSAEQEMLADRRRSEERLRAALAASATGTFRWDPRTGEFLEFDDNLKLLFGLPPEADVRSVDDLIAGVHPDDAPALLAAIAQCKQGDDLEMEFRVFLPDRSVRWLYARAKTTWDKGRPAYLVGACTDITTRKQMAETRHRLAAIVESSDDAIVSKNLNGIVMSWNAGAERLFGYSAEEMIGRAILTIIPPELHDEESHILSAIGRGERIEHYETVRVTKGGERVEVSLTISPVRDASGRIVGAAKIARNITQRNKTEQALRTAERLASVGKLAATVAHEINNPLEAVTNLVYLAKQQAVRPDVQEYLKAVEEELERISQLTRQTLGFYRETQAASVVSVGSLVSHTLPMFIAKIRNKGVRIRPEIRPHPKVRVYAGEIRQVVANLVSNSIDALEHGGEIRVRVSAAREWSQGGRRGVRITVADTGPGIPAAVRQRLFEPFFTTKKDVGTGLGLWVCKTIAEKHGGSIRMRTRTVPGSNWTTFTIFIPEAGGSVEQELPLRQAV